jgi:hypothetical protein
MATTDKLAIILTDQNQWIKWLELVKTAASERQVWQFINPATSADDLPILEMPEKPRPSDVSPPTNTAGDLIADPTEAQLLAVRYKSLDDNEREEYRQMQRDYEYERVKYDRCYEALAKISTRIQSSVHVDKMHYTYNCDLVYKMLLKLRKRFAPTDTICEQELALA